MKRLLSILVLTTVFYSNAMPVIPSNDCSDEVIKSAAINNCIVKRKNGEIITTNETMSLEIDHRNQTVIVELGNKLYDLVLYKTEESGTIHAATLNGKQIIKININYETNEVETLIGDLIFTTYIDSQILNNQTIAED